MQQNSDNKNNYNVFKYKLLTPGPVPMPPIALKALAQEALHHRTPKFEEILASSLSKLKLLFKTQQDVLIHTATGSGALESAVVNTLNSNEKVICIVSGKFGERWQKICETYNIPIIKYNVEWGQCADPKQLDELLQQNPGVQAVLTQHCETSTATLHPLKELARVCKKHQSLILVDAITSLGATEFLFDDWNIDVAVAGSQKAFMMPAGLSFICLSPLAWKRTKTSNLPKFYFNLSQESAAQMKASTYFSSAVSHITCLNETLSYLIDEALKLIRQKALDNGAADFNFDQFYVGTNGVSNVIDTIEMLPMMCKRRVVFFKGVQSLKDSDWERLFPYLEAPIDTTCFVLVATKVDKRKKFLKLIDTHGQLVELKRPYENQIPAWIDYMAHQNGLQFNRDSLRFLQQLVGNNLSEINAELLKLKQYLGEKTQVQVEDIAKVTSKLRIDTVFDLAAAIGRKDRASALVYLANILEHGQNEISALSLILRHVRILASVKEGQKQGLNGQRLSSFLGVPHFFLNEYVNQAGHWTEKQIGMTLSALHDTDLGLKSSPVSSHIWLENFIVQTCG